MSELIAYKTTSINQDNFVKEGIFDDFDDIKIDLYNMKYTKEHIDEIENLIDNLKDNMKIKFENNNTTIFIEKQRMLKKEYISILHNALTR